MRLFSSNWCFFDQETREGLNVLRVRKEARVLRNCYQRFPYDNLYGINLVSPEFGKNKASATIMAVEYGRMVALRSRGLGGNGFIVVL